jgi:TolA-binding protein
MRTLILTLLLSTAAHAQFDAAVNTLGQAGWFNSHHQALKIHHNQNVQNHQAEEMRLHRELANEQIRASQGFQRNPMQQQTCFQTQYGLQCR